MKPRYKIKTFDQRKCLNCTAAFQPFATTQYFCSARCALFDAIQANGDWPEPAQCWPVPGTHANGMGRILYGNRAFLAHRLAYQELKPDFKLKGNLRKVCGSLNCCNPDHAEPIVER